MAESEDRTGRQRAVSHAAPEAPLDSSATVERHVRSLNARLARIEKRLLLRAQPSQAERRDQAVVVGGHGAPPDEHVSPEVLRVPEPPAPAQAQVLAQVPPPTLRKLDAPLPQRSPRAGERSPRAGERSPRAGERSPRASLAAEAAALYADDVSFRSFHFSAAEGGDSNASNLSSDLNDDDANEGGNAIGAQDVVLERAPLASRRQRALPSMPAAPGASDDSELADDLRFFRMLLLYCLGCCLLLVLMVVAIVLMGFLWVRK